MALGGALAVWYGTRRSDPGTGTLQVAKAPADEEALLAWAENVLAGKCMTAAGFDFRVAAPQAREHERVDQFDELYGRSDVAEARQRGFGISAVLRPAEQAVEDPNLPYLSTLTDQESQRFDRTY